MRRFVVPALLATFLYANAPLDAQVVRGRVVETVSGAPIRIAVVSLLTADSVPTNRRTLTDAAGDFAITASSAGDFVLEVRAIGFRRLRQSVHLAAGRTTSLDVRLTRADIALSSVRVEGRRSCRHPDHVNDIGTALWDDVWSALSATTLAGEQSSLRHPAFRYRRELDRATGIVMGERREERSRGTSQFVAAAARDIGREGFIREDDAGNLDVFAPDARTLLSTDFIAMHCFAVTRDDSSARPRLGIAFWPQRSAARRGIDGVFWLDATTRELQVINFIYPALERLGPDSLQLGGTVAFARENDGAWYVSRWRIRAPIIQRTRRWAALPGRRVEQEPNDSVAAISEEGGIVMTDATHLASIDGRLVGDSSQALAGGTFVELPALARFTDIDSSGAFRFTNLLPGRYALRLTRPGSIDTRPLWHARVVDVREGERVKFEIPALSVNELARALCSRAGQREVPTVAVAGVVRDAGTGESLAGVPLELRWSRFIIDSKTKAISMRGESQSLTTDKQGAFSTCRVPTKADVSMHDGRSRANGWSAPTRLGDVVSILDVVVDSSGSIVRVDGGDHVVAVASSQGSARDTMPNVASISAIVVRDDSLARPVEGAEVHIAALAMSTVTDADGRFAFANLPNGTHLVAVRALGYSPVAREIPIDGRPVPEFTLRMQPAAPVLSEVRVSGEADPISVGLREFRDRERAGFGKFLTPEDLERAGDLSMTSIVASRVQGFEFIPIYRGTLAAGTGIAAKRFRTIGGGLRPAPPCFAQVFVDGMRVTSAGTEAFDISQLKTSEVMAMEFYRGASETPTQFSGPSAACGTVVIWTRAGAAHRSK